MLQLRLVFLCLLFWGIYNFSPAQNNWSVSVIDSFQTTNGGQGVRGLNSVVNNNTIHLTYYYHDQNSVTKLLYSVKNGSAFNVDTVATIADFNSYGVSTSLQFNEDGTKWIYAGFYSYPNHIIGVFKETSSGWDYTYIDETGNDKTVAAIQNNTEMGFTYSGKGENIYKQNVKYAHWNNGQWEITTVSKRQDTYKTKPSIIEAGGKIYLVFGEGRYPDSLITKVYVKENQVWQESFTDLMEIPYSGGSIGGLKTLLGISEQGNPCVLHSLSNEVHPRYYELTDEGWLRKSIIYPSTYVLTNSLSGSNILFGIDNTMYTISQGNGVLPRITWIKENGDADFTSVPYKHGGIYLQDFSILNNEVYIYYIDGYTSWPYDRPVTLKEAKIDLNVLITGLQHEDENLTNEFELYQNYPNPFNPITQINYLIPESGMVKLEIINSLGQIINTPVDEYKEQGSYTFSFESKNLSTGVYFYRLSFEEKFKKCVK
ncbi:MAG: T9SS type A sorting domain-containing protein [Melioribacteraceae bacterium]|nr:T9SS type A sorting domain-containing protein [Melioribacteraceae bacterium]